MSNGSRTASGRRVAPLGILRGVMASILGLAIGAALALAPSTAGALDWPLKGKDQNTTPISNVYGQFNDFGGSQYTHPGVDFKADKDTISVAGINGTINAVYTNGGTDQGVSVKTAPGNTWAWVYYHIAPTAGLAAGQAVGPATELGKVVDNYATWNHLHLGYVDANNIVDTGMQNPLRHITYTDTIKPTIPQDGFRMYPNQTENVYYKTTIPNTNLGVPMKDQTLVGLRAPLQGALPAGSNKSEIDVAVSAYDQINGSPYHLGLYRMGYFIDGFNYLPASASVDPHVTFRFWDAAPNQTNGAKNLIYKDDNEAKSAGQWTETSDEGTNGKGTFWHIVTNTTDTSLEGDPNSSGLSAAEAWKTVGGAANNAKARSPDGEYNIVSFAHDLKLNSAADFTRVRVDNFEQLGAVKTDRTAAFMASPTYNLPSETAEVNPENFFLDEDVYTRAVEMLGGVSLTAFLFPHRAAWSEGDLLTGFIASTTLLTDADGQSPFEWIWRADALGLFDIIVDYDSDGEFSYTLDALIGFRVIVPEPSSIALTLAGLASLAALHRRKRAAA